ncbi:coiled-coil domain-containing protein [Acrasis kona]|uniref:Coiled-coil domain-containing protein n=1 Tax=Acrasis kona TaxID=1008807 RepID=A0AAW2YRA4_9EUKA
MDKVITSALAIVGGWASYGMYQHYKNNDTITNLDITPETTIQQLYTYDKVDTREYVKLKAKATTQHLLNPIKTLNGSVDCVVYEFNLLRRDEITHKTAVVDEQTKIKKEHEKSTSRDVLVHDAVYMVPFCLTDSIKDPYYIEIEKDTLRSLQDKLKYMLKQSTKTEYKSDPRSDLPYYDDQKFIGKLIMNSGTTEVEMLSQKVKSGDSDLTHKVNETRSETDKEGNLVSIKVKSTGDFIVVEKTIPVDANVLVIGQVCRKSEEDSALVIRNIKLITNKSEQEVRDDNEWIYYGSLLFGGVSAFLSFSVLYNVLSNKK